MKNERCISSENAYSRAHISSQVAMNELELQMKLTGMGIDLQDQP
jgi:hypothetical protein